MDSQSSRWLFGYGSILWKTGFPYATRKLARVEGWSRRFWQGSPDHRGTPEAPGRVVTLIEAPGQSLWGLLYELPSDEADGIISALDAREQGGYTRHQLRAWDETGGEIDALTYIATPDNPCYLGPAPERELAAHIARSHGPSGSNLEYLRQLVVALDALGYPDPELTRLWQLAQQK